MARLAQTVDFLEECDCLYELLEPVPDRQWQQPTQFKGWTCNDVIGHLHIFDYAARLTLEGPEVLQAFFAQIAAGRANGDSLVSYTRRWLGHSQGISLLQKWRAFYRELASAYSDLDPGRRVVWGGPDMSVRSLISARQMETWAHGQAIFDVLGVTRRESDRLKNIAVMGVNTNTVLRALRVLRDEGLLEMRPRRGISVVGTPAESEVRGKVAELVALARRRGYTRADLLRMIGDAP